MAKILVVDDDRAVQEMLIATLRSNGYEASGCRDGSKVMGHLETGTFDLVILDVLIPHKNGFTLLEEIRQDSKLREMPVIMISGIYRSRNHRKEMREKFAVVEYLDKPVRSNVLLELIEGAVGPGAESDPVDQISVLLDHPKEPVPLTQRKGQRKKGESSDSHLVEPAAQRERLEVETASRDKFQTSAFLLQGSIKRQPVAAILGKLWYEKSTGGLLLRRDKVKKIVYVKEGSAYAVKSNLVTECLGQLLVRERLISEEECAASIERMQESGQKQGEILVEMRSMTEKNLEFALELQLEKKLFETFTWEDGEFRFNSTIQLPPVLAKLEWAGAAIITEGVRRTFDETRLRGLMLPILDVPLQFRRPDPDFDQLALTKKEREAVDVMAFPHTARELLDRSPLPPPDALRVIYTLIALDLVIPRV